MFYNKNIKTAKYEFIMQEIHHSEIDLDEIEKKATENGHCPDCKHFKSGEINFYEADTPRSCSKGNTATFEKFFSDCGSLTREQSKDYVVPCFEPTEHAMKLQNLIDLTSNLLDKVK